MLHQLSKRCTKLATAHELLDSEHAHEDRVATLAASFALGVKSALARESSLRWLPGEEMHLTVYASPDDPALNVYAQPSPLPPTDVAAELSSPFLDHSAARHDLSRGAENGRWATPLVHPTLEAAAKRDGFEELLMVLRGSRGAESEHRVIEGLNSNLFVAGCDGTLRTAGLDEGAYDGSVREAVLRLARSSSLFEEVIESAPSVRALAAGEWREAWLTCTCRRLVPLSRIWQPEPAEPEGSEGKWVELRAESDVMTSLRSLLDADMMRESEPIF